MKGKRMYVCSDDILLSMEMGSVSVEYTVQEICSHSVRPAKICRETEGLLV